MATKKKAVKKKVVKKKVVKKKAVKPTAKQRAAKRPKTNVNKKNKNDLQVIEQAFCDHYILLDDATAAYHEASPRKLKQTTARSNGCRMLKRPCVQAYLAKRAEAVQKKVNYDQEMWFADAIELKEMAMGKIAVPNHAVIEGVVIPLGDIKKVDMPSARATLDMIGKSNFLKLFENKMQLGADDQLAEILGMIKPTLGPPSKRGATSK